MEKIDVCGETDGAGKTRRTVRCRFQRGELELPLREICYVESQLHRMVVHTWPGAKYEVAGRMKDFEALLGGDGFCRVHKGFLVNLEYVERIVNYQMRLRGGKVLPVSKERYVEVKTAYFRKLEEGFSES